ncbi:CPBP family intramembrane metalloprotease [Halorussus salilacus]|uniref:CPBP family intramembrane glutamic endopeptidase n=1 Tax=Halorussus salilacus TaxID=2953750 RepID=UPI00209E1A21|nr:type II CAAX endopeptidase family protein [Halorussus salilacus]USZ66657.1 CPBP family intramembrane metalloprotease [Halorussus salilacus]
MSHRTAGPVRSIATATGVSALGVVFSVLLSIPVFVVSLDLVTQFVAALVLSELGFVAAALVFLRVTRRGLGYLDIGLLDRRALGFVIAGTVGLFVFRIAAILAAQAAGLPLAGNSVTQLAEEGLLVTLLALVPLSILVIGPAEELLFRGVVQRYLAESLPEFGAVALASVLFALVHVPTTFVATPDPLAVGVTLAILFGLSMLLGYLYVWTDNLLVPILVHGFYDALLFALAYAALSSDGLPTVVA